MKYSVCHIHVMTSIVIQVYLESMAMDVERYIHAAFLSVVSSVGIFEFQFCLTLCYEIKVISEKCELNVWWRICANI